MRKLAASMSAALAAVLGREADARKPARSFVSRRDASGALLHFEVIPATHFGSVPEFRPVSQEEHDAILRRLAPE